jgi:hypothetical protein
MKFICNPEREESAGKPTNGEAQLPNGKPIGKPIITDRELMQQALDALDAYSWEQVQTATNALRDRLAQPETPEVTPEVTPYVIDCGQWVGLTDDEIKSLPSWWPSYEDAPALIKLVKDVEAKLREKNEIRNP